MRIYDAQCQKYRQGYNVIPFLRLPCVSVLSNIVHISFLVWRSSGYKMWECKGRVLYAYNSDQRFNYGRVVRLHALLIRGEMRII
jgi:hypothetical protein